MPQRPALELHNTYTYHARRCLQAVWRRTLAPVQLEGGCEIPAGWRVQLNIGFAVQNIAEWQADAELFKPDRRAPAAGSRMPTCTCALQAQHFSSRPVLAVLFGSVGFQDTFDQPNHDCNIALDNCVQTPTYAWCDV